MSDDYTTTIETAGRVAVGGSATGEIEAAGDRDWFAVEFEAGRTYRIDLRGSPTGDGTLADTFLRRILDSEGNKSTGDGSNRTYNDNHGGSVNSRVTFTATESGRYYIEASGDRDETGTYTLWVADVTPETVETLETPVVEDPPADGARAGAVDLGDITALDGPRFPAHSLGGEADSVNWFRFTLVEAKRVGLGLRRQDADGDLVLEDGEGNELHRSGSSGTANEWIGATLLSGTYYVRVEAREAGSNEYLLRYGVSLPDPGEVERLEAERASGEGDPQPPAFVEASYAFDLEENADGSAERVSLGTVSAEDPDGEEVRYSLAGGNGAGLFEIDESTGELFYTGSGEDYESGETSHGLTVRASDGSLHADVEVTVTVTDVVEISVADAEGHEGADGTVVFLVTLDRAASGPVTVVYETVDGTAVAGEDYTSASGTLTFEAGEIRKRVEVGLIDDAVEDGGETFALRLGAVTGGAVVADAEAVGTILNSESVPEPSGTDFAADTTTAGRVLAGESVTGEIDRQGDRDWFAVTLEAGQVYRFDLEGSHTDAGTLRNPYLRGIHDADGNLISGTDDNNGGAGWNSRKVFEPESTGTYYVAASGYGSHTGTYTLSVREGLDDYTADTSTTVTVEVGGSSTGEIDLPGDRDWFAVTLEAGKTYRIDLEGSPTDAGTLDDPWLRGIHDSDGNLISRTADDDGGAGRNSRTFFEPESAGTYYIAAGAYGFRTGTYQVSVTEIVDDYTSGRPPPPGRWR